MTFAGNFRSTLLGSFLARLLALQRQNKRTEDDSVVSDVIRLNYYGDWGQQFNLLLTYCIQLNEKFEPEIEHRHDKGGKNCKYIYKNTKKNPANSGIFSAVQLRKQALKK